MKIQYTGAVLDSSGYAAAARNNILALKSVGVDIQVNSISFEKQKVDLGNHGAIIKNLTKNKNEAKISILHATPPVYPKILETSQYNIGYAAWETDRLPPGWTEHINLLNEVWVPSEYNKEAFKRSGVEVPVFVMPHALNVEDYAIPEKDLDLANVSSDTFVFLSVGQWLERKNMVGLLKAFLTEFRNGENVTLILKTFFSDHINPEQSKDKEMITGAIKAIKARLYLENMPKVLLIRSMISKDQMIHLYNKSNCYVSLPRSEGFGIPMAEAMIANKPVITTDYGGVKEFLNERTGFPVKCMETPVSGMPWEIYQGNQVWAEPDLMDARKQMRFVFEHYDKALEVAKTGHDYIKHNLSWENIGRLMLERLEQIEI